MIPNELPKSSGVVFQSWAIAVAFLVQSAFIFFCERDAWSSGVWKCARGGVIERDSTRKSRDKHIYKIYISLLLVNRCDRLQLSSECVLILLFSLEICSSIEFDLFFSKKK